MNWIEKIEVWGDRHHPKWLDLLRIILGLIITIKGANFVSDTAALQNIIENSRFGQVSFVLTHYVAFAHLVGGPLIMAGLITRIAIVFQLPVLIGAILFVNAQTGFFSGSSDLWLSLIVCFLLVFFLIEGSGPWSVDEYMKQHPEKDDWEEELKK